MWQECNSFIKRKCHKKTKHEILAQEPGLKKRSPSTHGGILFSSSHSCECCQMWRWFLVGVIKLAWAWAWAWAWAIFICSSEELSSLLIRQLTKKTRSPWKVGNFGHAWLTQGCSCVEYCGGKVLIVPWAERDDRFVCKQAHPCFVIVPVTRALFTRMWNKSIPEAWSLKPDAWQAPAWTL